MLGSQLQAVQNAFLPRPCQILTRAIVTLASLFDNALVVRLVDLVELLDGQAVNDLGVSVEHAPQVDGARPELDRALEDLRLL